MNKKSRPLKILLIDDDEDDHFFFGDALLEINSDTIFESAFSGKSGIEKLQAAGHLPDYIFLDLNMPGNDGMQVLKQIKASEHIEHIPVIIYSTSKSDEHIIKSRVLGAVDFITKPSSMVELVKTIKLLLDRLAI